MNGQWLGQWSGHWEGQGGEVLPGNMSALIVGQGTLTGFGDVIIRPIPQNGPSGGANWLAGYKIPFAPLPEKRTRKRRDEDLLLMH